MYGVEVCPDTLRKHHQGWVQFKTPIGMKRVKTLLELPSAHLEPTRGSTADNEKYCEKDGQVTRFGKFIAQGQRTDVEGLRQMVEEGKSELTIAREDFNTYNRCYKALGRYKFLKLKEEAKRFRRVKVVLIQGRTGCGKTRLAMKYDPYVITAVNGLKWWDGYESEDCVLIDDFVDEAVPIQLMLRLLDGYTCQLEVKGGHTYAMWTKVIITTNQRTLYQHVTADQLSAFNRRISVVVSCFGENEEAPDEIPWDDL
jgi:hypothetical protein